MILILTSLSSLTKMLCCPHRANVPWSMHSLFLVFFYLSKYQTFNVSLSLTAQPRPQCTYKQVVFKNLYQPQGGESTIESNCLRTGERKVLSQVQSTTNVMYENRGPIFSVEYLTQPPGKTLQLRESSASCAFAGSVIQPRADHLICSYCASLTISSPRK